MDFPLNAAIVAANQESQWESEHAGTTQTGPVFAVLDGPDRLRGLAARTGFEAALIKIERLGDGAPAFAQGLPVLPRRSPKISYKGRESFFARSRDSMRAIDSHWPGAGKKHRYTDSIFRS